MQPDYKLLNDHTLLGKFSDGGTDVTLLFNFLSPREIHATAVSFNRERHESSVSVCPWPPRQVRCLGRKCQ